MVKLTLFSLNMQIKNKQNQLPVVKHNLRKLNPIVSQKIIKHSLLKMFN
jgi:hypothetical protein